MPSPIPDPRERPMSEISTSASQREPFKTFGQDYRYAETLQNPFPEVIFSGTTSTAHMKPPTSPTAVGGGDGATEATTDHDGHSSHRPNTVGSKEPAMREDIWVEPPEAPWYKTISKRKWAAIIICTVGITGVVLAILGAMNKLSGDSSSDSPSSAETASATNTLSASATSSSTDPTSTPQPHDTTINCSLPQTFLTHITWTGTEVGQYKSEFAAVSSAESCCSACLRHSGGGCAGWLYDATTEFTPCTKIIVSLDREGGEKDETCPRGYAERTYFAQADDEDGEGKGKEPEGGGVAGMGPCGREMVIQ